MDNKQIRYFSILYEELNCTRAARRLNVVQPALSAQIRRLEAELGVSLFERTGRGVTPTTAGNLFHQLSAPILRDFGTLQQRMRDIGGDATGEIAVGLVPSITSSVLADVLRAYTERFPGVLVRAAEAYSGMLADRVVSGKEDFAVINNLGEIPGLVVRPLVTEALVLVSRRGRGQKAPKRVGGAQLAKMDLILPSRQHGLRAPIDRYFNAEGLTVQPGLELDALVPVLELVETSDRVTILPLSAVRRAADLGRVWLTPFPDRRLTRQLVVIHRSQHPLSLAAERFVELLGRHLEAVCNVELPARKGGRKRYAMK